MNSCRMCRTPDIELLLDLGAHPVTRDLLQQPDEEPYRHGLHLAYCASCGFAQLDQPIPADRLYSNYICLSSWKPQPHISRIISILEELPLSPADTMVLEVGCNDGSFLAELRSAGWNRLVGLEPAADARAAAEKRGIDTIGGYFNASTAAEFVERYGKSNLLISRQVLEHVENLEGFSKGIAVALEIGGYALIEVPNFRFSIDWLDYGGIWEQHVNYFTLETISAYLAQAGIEVLSWETFKFSGEALLVVGRRQEKISPASSRRFDMTDSISALQRYGSSFGRIKEKFRVWSEHLRERGSVVLYGAGGRGCSLVNFMDIGKYFDYAVDDQLEKQGHYLPGANIPVRSPEALLESGGGTCILAVNAENEEKVLASRSHLNSATGTLSRSIRRVSGYPRSGSKK
ncbi:MAG: methyltransferase domain-containing protein [Candidatus Melainabacteria bacterium]|nr:methyltransferase domain-containing protein [Candidatus Melainabacteria bacterium]